jgi:hypothetical protein
MPTEITIMAYKYEELEGRAKDKAREKLTEWATNHDWWDGVYDIAKEDGQAKGFDIDDLRFSGFYSQGDGCHWTGRIDVRTFLEANLDERSAWYGEDIILLELWKEGWVDRYVQVHNRSYRYCHSGGMSMSDYPDNALESLDEDDDAVLKQGVMQGANVYQLSNSFNYDQRIIEWCDEALKQARKFADEVYKNLQDEYEHLTSDESLTEFAGANEYLFDERGNML